MSNSQRHGKMIEDHWKAAFPGASDAGRSQQSPWDIEPEYDRALGLPTFVEALKFPQKAICMADARKMWGQTDYRILIARYQQRGDVKRVFQLLEVLIAPDQQASLLGDVTLEEVADFHRRIQCVFFEDDKEAQIFAKKHKRDVFGNRSLLQLNPKISGTQRRVQCSLSLAVVLSELKSSTTVYGENDFYRNVAVAFAVQSSPREFSR